MDNLMQAINDHSHYDGADEANDNFWENLWDEYGAEYTSQTAQPSLSDFQVWADDHDLVPEVNDGR